VGLYLAGRSQVRHGRLLTPAQGNPQRPQAWGGDRGPGQLTPTRRSGDRGDEFRTGGEVTLPSGFLPLPSPSSSSLSPRFSIDDECFFSSFFAWLASRVRWWLVFSLSYSAARRTYRPLSNPVFSVPYESTTDPAGGRVGHLAPVTFGFLSPVRPIKI
jgi:hypothetical protein